MSRVITAITFLVSLALLPAAAGAASADVDVQIDIDLSNKAALQRGAKTFVNYWSPCRQ